MVNEPIQMDYETYATLKNGNHATAQAEVMENILKGQVYIVTYEKQEHQIIIGDSNHLRLIPYIPAKKH